MWDKLLEVRSEVRAGGANDFVHLAKSADNFLKLVLTSFNSECCLDGDVFVGYHAKLAQRGIDKLPLILSGFESLPFDITFKDFDPSDVFLHPAKVANIPEDQLQPALRRASDETRIGGPLKFPQLVLATLMAILCVTPDDELETIRTDRFMGRLKYYVSQSGGTPFLESSRDHAVVALDYDLMAATRCNLLFKAFVWSRQGFPRVDVLEQAVMWIFRDPLAGAIKLKGMTSLMRQSPCALAAIGKGDVIRWDLNVGETDMPTFAGRDGALDGFKVRSVDVNDTIYYKSLEKELKEADVELMKEVPLLALVWRDLIRASPGAETMRQIAWYSTLTTIVGFIRTETMLSAKVQFDKGEGTLPEPEKVTMGPHIEELVDDAVTWAWKNDRLPTWEQAKAQVPFVLTNRSAGRDKAKFKVNRRREEGQVSKRPVEVVLTSKIGLFYMNPNKYMSPATVQTRYSTGEEGVNVGNLGTRDQQDRAPRRLIIMVRLEHHIALSFFYLWFMDWATSFDKELGPLAGTNDFTAGKESGMRFRDHAWGAYATGIGLFYILLTDFSQFDATLKYANFRRFIISGMLKALARRNVNGRWGPYPSYANLFQFLSDLTKDAAFKQGVDPETKETIIRLLDAVLSGELGTNLLDSIGNKANAKDIYLEWMRNGDLARQMKLLLWKFMGDDAGALLRVLNIDAEYGEAALNTYLKIRDTVVEVSERNGFQINASKTVMRRCYYEYLKIIFLYGWSVPRRAVPDPLVGENKLSLSPVQFGQAFAAILNTSLSRGGPHDMYRFLSIFLARLAFNVRYDLGAKRLKGEDRNPQLYYLPIALLWTPVGAGGSGQLPWTIAGTNKDVMIYYLMSVDGDFRKLINHAAALGESLQIKVKKELAQELLAGNTEPRDIISPGVTWIQKNVIQPGRMMKSKKSIAFLANKGVDLGDAIYEKLPERMIKQAFENNRRFNDVEKQARMDSGKLLKSVAVKLKSSGPKDILKRDAPQFLTMRISFTDPLGSVLPEVPIAGLDPKVDLMYRTIGLSTAPDDNRITPAMIVSMLRRDKFTRLDPTMVLSTLSRSDVLHDTDLIQHSLIAMGLDEEVAISISAQFSTVADSFTFKNEAAQFSFGDQLLASLDLSRSSHERVTDITLVGRKHEVSWFYETGMMLCVNYGLLTGTFRRVQIDISDSTIATLVEKFDGRNTQSAFLRNVDIYGRTPHSFLRRDE
jgi:hypothetical protein